MMMMVMVMVMVMVMISFKLEAKVELAGVVTRTRTNGVSGTFARVHVVHMLVTSNDCW